MVRNLYFFLIINTFASYLFTMKSSEDPIYENWVSVHSSYENSGRLSPELRILKALAWTINNGGPSEIIEILTESNAEQSLREARSSFAIKYEGYTLEEAIFQNNLDFIKTIMPQEKGLKFKARTYGIALKFRREKITKYIQSTTPKLFTHHKTIDILQEYLSKSISDESLPSLEIFFVNNFDLSLSCRMHFLNYCLEESKKNNFRKGIIFLEEAKETASLKGQNLLTKTL